MQPPLQVAKQKVRQSLGHAGTVQHLTLGRFASAWSEEVRNPARPACRYAHRPQGVVVPGLSAAVTVRRFLLDAAT